MIVDEQLLEAVGMALTQRCLISGSERVLVAVSGGLDSMCLLTIMGKLAAAGRGPDLVAATVDHRLRDFSSEAAVVSQWCAGLGVPWRLLRLAPEVGDRAREAGRSLEHQMREERLAVLEQARDEAGAAFVALAHTADDQAETVLMRLARGSGLRGLSGMRPANAQGIVRPLLGMTRQRLEQFADAHKIPFVSDPTNRSPCFVRNRLRGEVLPLLEELFPGVGGVMARTADLLGQQMEAVASLLDQRLEAGLQESDEGLSVPVELLGEGPLCRMLLHRLFEHAGVYPPEAVHFSQLERLVASREGSSELSLPGNIVARREYGIFRLLLSELPRVGFSVPVPGEGSYPVPGGILTVRRVAGTHFLPSGDGMEAVFCACDLEFPLGVRSWKRGDRFWPFGFNGTRKVSDLFAEHRVPVSRRVAVPIVVDGDDVILWVVGLRRSAHWPVHDGDEVFVLSFATD